LGIGLSNQKGLRFSRIVTRGLDPRVHLFRWMAGSSPAMTLQYAARYALHAAFGSAALASA
jgi:hypothetical protein